MIEGGPLDEHHVPKELKERDGYKSDKKIGTRQVLIVPNQTYSHSCMNLQWALVNVGFWGENST